MEDGPKIRSGHWWRWVVALCFLGLVLRLAFVIFVTRFDVPVGDQLFYSAQALTNADGRWFEQPFAENEPAADHPPLTTLVLTPVSWLMQFEPVRSWSSVVTAQRLTMVILGTLGVALMASIGRKIGGRTVGLVAATVTTLYANIWVNDGLLMAETPTFVVVAALILFALKLERDSRWYVAASLGALSGLASLARPELVASLPLILGLIATTQWGRWRRSSGMMATAILIWSMFVMPWVVWNNLRFTEPVLLSTNDGLTIAGGHCDRTYFEDVGGWDIWCAYAVDVPSEEDASEASRRMRRVGLDYWREHVDRYPVVAAARLARISSVGFQEANAIAARSEGRPLWVSNLGMVQYWLLLPMAIIGWRHIGVRRFRLILISAVPVVVFVAMVANAYVRFRLPAEIGLVVLASVGIAHVVRRLSAPGDRSSCHVGDSHRADAPKDVSAPAGVCASG